MSTVTCLFSIALLALFCAPVQPATLCRCGEPKLGKHLHKLASLATTNVGQIWQLKCDTGYDIIGSSQIKCTTEGWSAIPTCLQKLTCIATEKDLTARKESRTDCGYPGIPESICMERGCCWDSSVYNVNWCFFHDQHDYSVKSVAHCNVKSLFPKENCGYVGISEDKCVKRGCCFDIEKEFCFFGLGDIH